MLINSESACFCPPDGAVPELRSPPLHTTERQPHHFLTSHRIRSLFVRIAETTFNEIVGLSGKNFEIEM
jgi:hypothetical protein